MMREVGHLELGGRHWLHFRTRPEHGEVLEWKKSNAYQRMYSVTYIGGLSVAADLIL